MVGPFIFFDQMGPAEFLLGQGMDVRPHPHIRLSTVTYLFDGEIMHRDSLGTELPIRRGELDWMTAGRGITHPERTGQDLHTTGSSASRAGWRSPRRTRRRIPPSSTATRSSFP
jgi:redox-sensitive bicupin YhaK (pirin superfamily)